MKTFLLSQRLADLERAVASMAQNVPVPPDESHESQNPKDPGSSGLNDVGRDLQVGSQAPQVQEPSDATREQYPPKDAALGASGSSSSDPKVAPRAPVGFPKSFAPPQPDIKSDAKRVQIQDGDPSLTELVHQLSKLVEAQVGVSGASPPIASAQAPPPSVAVQHTTAIPTLRLTSASTSQVAHFPSSPLAPSEGSDTSSESGDEGNTPSCRVCGGPHDDTACPSLSMNGGQGQGTQAADASGGDAATSASDPASHEETVVRIKDLKDLVLPLPPENAGQARGRWTSTKDGR